jgi:hypothetical protein
VKLTADYLPPTSCHRTEKPHNHDQALQKTCANHPAYHDLQKIFKKEEKTKKSTQAKYIFLPTQKEKEEKTNDRTNKSCEKIHLS